MKRKDRAYKRVAAFGALCLAAIPHLICLLVQPESFGSRAVYAAFSLLWVIHLFLSWHLAVKPRTHQQSEGVAVTGGAVCLGYLAVGEGMAAFGASFRALGIVFALFVVLYALLMGALFYDCWYGGDGDE